MKKYLAYFLFNIFCVNSFAQIVIDAVDVAQPGQPVGAANTRQGGYFPSQDATGASGDASRYSAVLMSALYGGLVNSQQIGGYGSGVAQVFKPGQEFCTNEYQKYTNTPFYEDKYFFKDLSIVDINGKKITEATGQYSKNRQFVRTTDNYILNLKTLQKTKIPENLKNNDIIIDGKNGQPIDQNFLSVVNKRTVACGKHTATINSTNNQWESTDFKPYPFIGSPVLCSESGDKIIFTDTATGKLKSYSEMTQKITDLSEAEAGFINECGSRNTVEYLKPNKLACSSGRKTIFFDIDKNVKTELIGIDYRYGQAYDSDTYEIVNLSTLKRHCANALDLAPAKCDAAGKKLPIDQLTELNNKIACGLELNNPAWKKTELKPTKTPLDHETLLSYLKRFQKPNGFNIKEHLGVLVTAMENNKDAEINQELAVAIGTLNITGNSKLVNSIDNKTQESLQFAAANMSYEICASDSEKKYL